VILSAGKFKKELQINEISKHQLKKHVMLECNKLGVLGLKAKRNG